MRIKPLGNFAVIVDANDRGVVQGRDLADLILQAPQVERIPSPLLCEELDRDWDVLLDMPTLPDDTHPCLPDDAV